MISYINPLFNNKTLKVSSAAIKINSGSSNPYEVGQIQQINERPFINSLMSIYDGFSSTITPVNLWDVEVPLDKVTNGLQFAPQTIGGVINAYDNLFQRNFEY